MKNAKSSNVYCLRDTKVAGNVMTSTDVKNSNLLSHFVVILRKKKLIKNQEIWISKVGKQ